MKIDLDTQTEANLKAIAACGNSSPEAVLAEMAAELTQDREQVRYWRERQEDMAAVQRYRDTGEHITEEAMSTKIDGLATKARNLSQNTD